jgi:hypothetical protein
VSIFRSLGKESQKELFSSPSTVVKILFSVTEGGSKLPVF